MTLLFQLDLKKLYIKAKFKSNQRPHQILQTGTFYIRRGSTTDIARRYEVASMLQENGILSCETSILPNTYIDDLDTDLLHNYFPISLDSNFEKSILILEAMGIIGRDIERDSYHSTLGGLLLFGKRPQTFMPATGINININHKKIYVDGNIPAMLDKVENILKGNIRNKDYLIDILMEIIYNAVVHRDYWDTTREISVKISNKNIEVEKHERAIEILDSIEVENPGAIWKNEGVINIDSLKNPPRRNMWLYQRLLIFDKKKSFTSKTLGLEYIQDTMDKNGHSIKFINLTRKNIFRIVLPGIDEFTDCI